MRDRVRGLAAGLAALLLAGLPPAEAEAQQPAAPATAAPAEPEMPPLPSMEGRQGEVISHSAVSAPARKHRADVPEPAKPAVTPVKGATFKNAATKAGRKSASGKPGRIAARSGAKPKAIHPASRRTGTAAVPAHHAAPRRRR